MFRTVLGWIGIVLVGVNTLQAARQQPSIANQPPSSPQRAVLNHYCVTCHNEKLKTAGLMLDKIDVEKVSEDAAVWEKVIRKLRTGAMPPAGMPRPDKASYDSFASYLETALDYAAKINPNPGRPTVHRLNRTEYTNTVRDLLATSIDGDSLFPADDSGDGFDNIGAVLSVSPLLLERYMSAARKISRLAIGDSGIETPSRSKIFICSPAVNKDEDRCAKEVLSTLARRAYRRPITDREIHAVLSFYKAGRSEGDFEAGIEMALQRILLSPKFLFRIERDPANVARGTSYPISDLELASRLSFFLWSSMPDDQLLDLASRGKLKNPAVLEQQVRRMLGDARSHSLVSNFAGQWLYLRNLHSVLPDKMIFPDFDENLREAFQHETELFLESNLREDRSVLNLLNADYTFVNERLAQFYGIPNIYGSDFRRVTLSDERRRGLLGQGSILTVTSYANRTSPVMRGKWVLDNILGSSPPPPPPNVPFLKDNAKDGKALSMRERMEQHRANPACAGCHSRMDPLGFAMENFDAIGKWRTTEADNIIDASGMLPDGTNFQGPAELRMVLVGHREEFVNCVTSKLLTYALGRALDYYDAPAVRGIIRNASARDYRWSSLILGIIKSDPFQMRRSQEL